MQNVINHYWFSGPITFYESCHYNITLYKTRYYFNSNLYFTAQNKTTSSNSYCEIIIEDHGQTWQFVYLTWSCFILLTSAMFCCRTTSANFRRCPISNSRSVSKYVHVNIFVTEHFANIRWTISLKQNKLFCSYSCIKGLLSILKNGLTKVFHYSLIFSVAAPSLWNAPSHHLTLTFMTTAAFKVKLKTYLFARTLYTAL